MSANPFDEMAVRFFEIFNQGNLEAWLNDFAPEYIHHNSNQPDVKTREQFRDFHINFQANFPGVQGSLEDIVSQGTLASGAVVLHYHVQGTGKGMWRGAQVDGKPINFQGFLLFKVANGKFVEGWELNDVLTVLMQVGRIPFPSSALQPNSTPTPA